MERLCRFRRMMINFWEVPRLEKGWKTLLYADTHTLAVKLRYLTRKDILWKLGPFRVSSPRERKKRLRGQVEQTFTNAGRANRRQQTKWIWNSNEGRWGPSFVTRINICHDKTTKLTWIEFLIKRQGNTW
jgi:hypothetical protein